MEAQEKMDGAIDNWALDNNKKHDDKPMASDRYGPTKYLREKSTCPVGGPLAITPVGEEADCPAGKHKR